MTTARHQAAQVAEGPWSRGASPGTALRAVLLGLAGAAGAGLLTVVLCQDVVGVWAGVTGDGWVEVSDGVRLLAAAAGAAVSAWLGVLLLLGSAAAVPGRLGGRVRRLAPRWGARSAGLLLALSAGSPLALAAPTGVIGPTTSMTTPDRPPMGTAPADVAGTVALVDASTTPGDQPSEPGEGAPVPGWRPTTPPAQQPKGEVGLVSRGSADLTEVVVRSGDTLWDIAARQLGPDASIESIAAEWPRWYGANRNVIGPDPDLILPGQRLVPPAGPASSDGSRR